MKRFRVRQWGVLAGACTALCGFLALRQWPRQRCASASRHCPTPHCGYLDGAASVTVHLQVEVALGLCRGRNTRMHRTGRRARGGAAATLLHAVHAGLDCM